MTTSLSGKAKALARQRDWPRRSINKLKVTRKQTDLARNSLSFRKVGNSRTAAHPVAFFREAFVRGWA
jgi:hypothetical protein